MRRWCRGAAGPGRPGALGEGASGRGPQRGAMRARSALALAVLLALPVVLSAVPARDPALQRHATGALLGAQLEGVLDRAAPREGAPLRGILAPAAPLDAGRTVHVLVGERAWSVAVPPGGALLDLDGDGQAELRAHLEGNPPALGLAGLAPARAAWAVWVEHGGGRVGLTGAGPAPAAALASLREGALRVVAEGAPEAWTAAFASAGAERRTLAFRAAGGPVDLEASLGLGFRVRAPEGVPGALRLLLAEGPRSHDLTLAEVPAGAQVLADALQGLHYRAPSPGGALAYAGPADIAGQRGALTLDAEPLPARMDLAQDGEGLTLQGEPDVDAVVDWRPPGGAGMRFIANDADRVTVQPGPAGGIVVDGGRGRVAFLRTPASGEGDAESKPGEGLVVDLGTQGAAAVGAPTPLGPAVLTLALAALVVWAVRGKRAPQQAQDQRQVE
jgi:hypothetical protein